MDSYLEFCEKARDQGGRVKGRRGEEEGVRVARGLSLLVGIRERWKKMRKVSNLRNPLAKEWLGC